MAPSEPGPELEILASADLESTATLLTRVRAGDPASRERLVARYRVPLERWAHRRLPFHARDLVETQDLVQVTLIKALEHVNTFEPRREGAFLAYLRQILINEIRMEVRRVGRRPGREPVTEDLSREALSPLDAAIGSEIMAAYEKALALLSDEEREGVILRIEFGFTHQQVAEALGKSSPDAARMLVTRAMVRLMETMDVHRKG